MGQKKDIGTLFETKLSAGNKIPKESLWEKINTSLDEEKRKRKRLLLYWWLGGSISVLLGLFLLFGARNFLNQNSQIPLEQDSSELNSFSNSEKENTETTINISEKDSFQFESNVEEKLSKIVTPTKDLKQSEAVNDSENNKPENKTKTISSNTKQVDETFTISEKYYYYNSRDGKQLVTESKKEIDSLISKQYKSLDTLPSKKNDSLK